MATGNARIRKYSAAVLGMDSRKEIIPDYTIEPTQKYLIKKRDVVMEFALSLINSKP